MMLKYSLGQPALAAKIDQAVKSVLDNGVRTRDIGGTASTVEVGAAVATELESILVV